MNVSQLMNRTVVTCSPGEPLASAAGKMWDHDIGCLPVVDGTGRVMGMVTDRDICMAAYTQGLPLQVLAVAPAMSREVYSCLPSDALIEAEEVMRSRRVRRLPVIDGEGKLVGILSLNDLAREAAREQGKKGRELTGQEVNATLSAVCEPRRPSILSVVA